jgi:hypothetical protein
MGGSAFAGMPTTQFGQLTPAAYGSYGFGNYPFGMQAHPYSQPYTQGAFGYGGIQSPFGMQTLQSAPQQWQLLHTIPQQLQQLQYLQQYVAQQIQQLSQIVPQQLQQLHQLLQLLPQQIQQLQQQLLWQQSGIQSLTGLSQFGSPQTSAGPWTWSTQAGILGQPGLGQTFGTQAPIM